MCVNFGSLLGRTLPINEQARADDAWRRINRSPARADDGELGIEFTKPRVVEKTGVTPETTLPRQLVRVESDDRPSPLQGEAGTTPKRHAVVYGIRNHRTLPDTDMEEGYSFEWQGDHYRCIDVILVPGEKQGTFIVNG
jgi:hypothetical protein